MRRLLTYTLAVVFLATSLEAADRPAPHPTRTGSPRKTLTAHRRTTHQPYQVGLASWYGKPFQGKETASGEPYDMYDLTAAHRRLPLGSLVRVTNLKNGASVVVRINDRGPVLRSRIIDLSYGAARVLRLKAEGIQMVRLDILRPETVAVAAEALGGGLP